MLTTRCLAGSSEQIQAELAAATDDGRELEAAIAAGSAEVEALAAAIEAEREEAEALRAQLGDLESQNAQQVGCLARPVCTYVHVHACLGPRAACKGADRTRRFSLFIGRARRWRPTRASCPPRSGERSRQRLLASPPA